MRGSAITLIEFFRDEILIKTDLAQWTGYIYAVILKVYSYITTATPSYEILELGVDIFLFAQWPDNFQ